MTLRISGKSISVGDALRGRIHQQRAERLLDSLESKPAEDCGQRRYLTARCAWNHGDQPLGCLAGEYRGGDPAYDLALAVAFLESCSDRRERAGSLEDSVIAASEQCRQRRHDVLLSQRSERLGGRRLQELILQQGHDPARRRWVADECERIEGREGDGEITRLGDTGQCVRRLPRAYPAERLDGVEAHIRVIVGEGAQQGGNRAPVFQQPQCECGIRAHVAVRVGRFEQLDHGRQGVLPRPRECGERRVEHPRIAVTIANRGQERVERDVVVRACKAVHGGEPHAPTAVAKYTGERRRGAHPVIHGGELLRGLEPNRLIGALKLRGDLALAVDARGDILALRGVRRSSRAAASARSARTVFAARRRSGSGEMPGQALRPHRYPRRDAGARRVRAPGSRGTAPPTNARTRPTRRCPSPQRANHPTTVRRVRCRW